MGISIGLVGLGSFGSAFAAMYKHHPLVDRIGLCDREPERIEKFAKDPFFADKFNPKDAYTSLDDICQADFDALVIITQPWLHAPQCIQAMESGKHVYSAVPIITVPDNDEILDWCDKLVETVQRTGQHYMLGETTYFHPEAMYCRRKAREGAFGHFVYAEGEYMHDLDANCNLRQVRQSRTSSTSGQEWLKIRERYIERQIKGGPMHYPTHSVSGPVCVMNARALTVNAIGFRNQNNDPYFHHDAFSNEMALFKMDNGSAVRILEAREFAGRASETFRIFGTQGAYYEHQWGAIERPDFENLDMKNLPKPQTQPLTSKEMFDPLPEAVETAFKEVMHQDLDKEALLSVDFQPQGHGGSHPYLVHEFVEAIAQNRIPAINVWEATHYMAMGVAAHQSALEDGATVSVANWGYAPT